MVSLSNPHRPSTRTLKQVWLDFVARLYAVLDESDRGLGQYLTFKQAVLALVTDNRFVAQLASHLETADEDVAAHGEVGIGGSGVHISRALTEALRCTTSDLTRLTLGTPDNVDKEERAAKKRIALARAGVTVGCLSDVSGIIFEKNNYSRTGLTLLEKLIGIYQTGRDHT